MRKNSGFTAFELALTMAIMGIIASFVLPPYIKWNREHRLRGAVTNMMADMEMAKIKAIRENSMVAVQFCQDRYTIFNENGDTNYTCVTTGREVYRDRKLPAGVEIDLGDLNFANNRTRFNGRGLPDGMTAARKIPLKNKTNGQEITVNRLGYMKVQ
ncbi:MAG: GspH/FimT family pseudopilin [Proteobacteria bacterium]|nr:GspH/FimT family pseudopilin [Pseudomonadota bacterium]